MTGSSIINMGIIHLKCCQLFYFLYNLFVIQVIVVGTGLEESMVAASAARNGHSVLHVDINDYYGGTWSAFNFEGMQKWIEFHQQERPTQPNSSENDSSDTDNSKIKDELRSFLKENERLVLYSHDNVDCDISDVNQEWHLTKEKDQDNSLECNISDTETAQTSDNKPLNVDTSCELDVEIQSSINKDNESFKGVKEEHTPSGDSNNTSSECEKKEGNTLPQDSIGISNEEATKRRNRYPWTEQKIVSCSRNFNLDLVPRLLYAKGAMVELLISSNISRYTEFKVRMFLLICLLVLAISAALFLKKMMAPGEFSIISQIIHINSSKYL